MLRLGLTKRDPMLLDLAMDVLVPPLAKLVAWSWLGAIASVAAVVWLQSPPIVTLPWLLACLFLVFYVLRGVALAGLGFRGILDLAWAPVYIVWKLVGFAPRQGPTWPMGSHRTRRRGPMIGAFIRDAIEMARASTGSVNARSVARTVLLSDSYAVMAMTRAREACRRWHVPGVNRALRLAQTVLFGIEVGKDVTFGDGVYFVHTLGTVVGGDSQIGSRVRFMGNNTIGTAKDNGCPVIEDDVVVGCGARILGPVRIGARAQIGANAVVLSDIPADAVAVGVPAVVLNRSESTRVIPDRKPRAGAVGHNSR